MMIQASLRIAPFVPVAVRVIPDTVRGWIQYRDPVIARRLEQLLISCLRAVARPAGCKRYVLDVFHPDAVNRTRAFTNGVLLVCMLAVLGGVSPMILLDLCAWRPLHEQIVWRGGCRPAHFPLRQRKSVFLTDCSAGDRRKDWPNAWCHRQSNEDDRSSSVSPSPLP